MEELTKKIEDFIIEKSLSLEVLTIVTKIRDEHSKLTKDIENQRKTLEIAKETIIVKDQKIIELNTEIIVSKEIINIYKKREKEFIDSEHTISLMYKNINASQMVSCALKEVVGMVFKSPVYRKSSYGIENIPVNSVNGSGFVDQRNINKTEEVTEE